MYLHCKGLLTVVSIQALGVAIVMVGKLARGLRRMVVIVATCCLDMRTEQNNTNGTKAALERYSGGMIAWRMDYRSGPQWLFL